LLRSEGELETLFVTLSAFANGRMLYYISILVKVPRWWWQLWPKNRLPTCICWCTT